MYVKRPTEQKHSRATAIENGTVLRKGLYLYLHLCLYVVDAWTGCKEEDGTGLEKCFFFVSLLVCLLDCYLA